MVPCTAVARTWGNFKLTHAKNARMQRWMALTIKWSVIYTICFDVKERCEGVERGMTVERTYRNRE
jgi:hypothetical protein